MPKKTSQSTNNPQGEDRNIDATLRPTSWDEYVGQEKIKNNLRVILEASKKRNEASDHLLFSGPAGLGKTTLAYLVARELGGILRTTSGPAIEKAAETVLHVDPLNYRAQMVSAYQQYTAKNYAVALASYRRVLTYYPDDMTALSGEAWSLYYLGQSDKAAIDFETLLGVNSDDSWAQKGLALCQARTTN